MIICVNFAQTKIKYHTMRNMKNWFLVTFFFLAVSTGFAQGKITGMIFDEKGPLPGANVVIEGTSVGTTSDFDGSFTLNTTASNGKVVISFLGFKSAKIDFSAANGQTVDLGTIVLKSDDNVLGEVVVTSTVIDIAKDRKTPVASSTIKASEIKEKLGNKEFPEILNNTPSVYATKAGGGFGDSRINVRGFSQENVAVMVNGVPVNDMENGRVFWSNWAGISDVTSALQVQRGLGSSKLAISSVGGTINIITRSSDIAQGGSVSTQVSNNDSYKWLASYSTGKMKSGFSTSVLFSQTKGNTYVDNTKYEGYNYFIGLGYELNDKHDFQFVFTGAPQTHDQRSTFSTIADYIKYGDGVDPNRQYNPDAGYLNGEVFNTNSNFYHKPVMSLNWDWKINESTKLSTIVYGSWGRGAGASMIGRIRGKAFNNASFRLADGSLDMQKIYDWNSGQTVIIDGVPRTRQMVNGFYQNDNSTSSTANNFSGISKINSFNSHDWYGGIINVNKKFGEHLTVDFGLDARSYHGIHFQSVNNLLGADAYNSNYTAATASTGSNGDINGAGGPVFGGYQAEPSGNPFKNYDYQTKVNYNNDGFVRWYGAFTQAEYSVGKITAFVQGAISQQRYQRADYFKYLTTDPLYKTKFENILGGNVKGGINYNIDDNHNVFANGGYYSKQPNFRSVYPNNLSVLNENLTNEKVLGVEAGYGFRSSKFNANVNVYHTTWKDRYDRRTITSGANAGGYVELPGLQEVHDGVELDMSFRPFDMLKFNGMFSYGNWYYKGNATANEFDVANSLLSSSPLYLDDVKVGDAAQMTASLGATVEPLKGLKFDANYRLVDHLYASIDTRAFSKEDNKGSLELPSYGLLDAGASLKVNRTKDSKDYFTLRLNIDNVLDETYISESRTNIFADDYVSGTSGPTYASAGKLYDGVANGNQVFFGFGRTWNFTFSYNF